MGLDIQVWTNLTRTEEPDHNQEDFLHVGAGHLADFPGRAAPLGEGWYAGEQADRFRGGSYSGYNDWREWLAQLAGYPATVREKDTDHRHLHSVGAWVATGGPFWESINFTDCDGVLGTTVCRKLATDFAEWENRAVYVGEADEWEYRLYRQFRHAFETAAASGGAVEFT